MNGHCGYFRTMIVSIGCDHAGPALKTRISAHLAAKGHELLNRGTDGLDSVDYPDYAHAVADDVGTGNAELGILICGSANGVAMTANATPFLVCRYRFYSTMAAYNASRE